jgi:hypothetical protein
LASVIPLQHSSISNCTSATYPLATQVVCKKFGKSINDIYGEELAQMGVIHMGMLAEKKVRGVLCC